MNMVEFSQQIPSESLATIFKNFFEQHIVAYDVLKGIIFKGIRNIDFNKSSIVYSVELLNTEDLDKMLKNLSNISLNIYGKSYTPIVSIHDDLLYITINK